MKSHLPRWPTGSPDPIVNIVSTGILVILGILVFATGFVLLVPIALGFGILGLLRWYHNRPPPYANPALPGAVAQRTIEANFPDRDAFVRSYVRRLIDAWEPKIPALSLLNGMADASATIYEMEQLTNPIPPVLASDPIELATQADEFNYHMAKVADAPRTLAVLADALTRSLGSIRDRLPATMVQSRNHLERGLDTLPPLSVPLIEAVPDLPWIVYDVAMAFYTDEIRDLGLFRQLKARLNRNDATASAGVDEYVRPWEFQGSAREIVDVYLHGTPLHRLFDAELPFVLPGEARFSGHWILSPPGRGKTTLLHAMVMADIQNPGACVILMDSKGDLIDPIRNLTAIQDRLILIDLDPGNPIAINPLDMAYTNVAQSVDLLEYLFASLLEFKMTPMQTTLFRSVLRALVTTFPNPTLETFRDVLTNGCEKYAAHLERLPPDLQDFFTRDFNDRNYAERRREVLQRLRLLLDNDTMRAMLTAVTTRFHIGEAMDTGKIIIINNSKAKLGDTGAEFFGRFFIAQVLAAAQQRSARAAHHKPPVYFYIDEAQNVIARDEKISTILDECRSQNIALIMAHQRTRQITSDNVLDALSNCAIRFANSDEEARLLASRLRTSPELLQSLGRGQFAAFVRDMAKHAVTVSVNRVDFAKLPAIGPEQSRLIQERMRQEYGVPQQAAPAAALPTGKEASQQSAEPLLSSHPNGTLSPTHTGATPGAAADRDTQRPGSVGSEETTTKTSQPGQTMRPKRSSAPGRPRHEQKEQESKSSEGATDWR